MTAATPIPEDCRPLALVKGAGDLASGVALYLARAGFSVAMTETARPTAVRRTVAFAEAVYSGRTEVEGLQGILAEDLDDARRVLRTGAVAVLVDPEASVRSLLHPDLLVDAVMAKRNLGTRLGDAPVVIALGPGFVAGRDAHAVIETMRGETLGQVITRGEAIPDTGIPGERHGFAAERVVRSPLPGVFTGLRDIGDWVTTGEAIGMVEKTPVETRVEGRLRGILHSGLTVHVGFKLGDVDPGADLQQCFLISDKAATVAQGVMDAARALMGSTFVRTPPLGFRLQDGGRAITLERAKVAADKLDTSRLSGSDQAFACGSPSTAP